MSDAPDEDADLFERLRASYATLQAVQKIHDKTPYNCQQHGACCQVGLQIPVVECKHIADQLVAACEGDKRKLARWIKRLEASFEDKTWTWASSVGEKMCAFYDKGCTIYPFRPAVCRAYGVVIGVDEFCPRKRLPSGEPYSFVQPEMDRMMASYNLVVDSYGRRHRDRDWTVYMPAGVLSFLLSPERLAALKARTDKRFWRRYKGYRTQFEPSYRTKPSLRTNVRFPALDKLKA